MQTVRPPAVAGAFYPAEPQLLGRTVQELLDRAPVAGQGGGRPKALIVPHAGYQYSGSTAAAGYAAMRPYAESISKVVLLGPAHRVAVNGLALPDAEAFDTPLGRIMVDREGLHALEGLVQVVSNSAAHQAEHSLEVQLPFLQRLLGSFTIVPLLVGQADPEMVAEVLERLWGGPETLIVVSSDLSHYLPYEQAQEVDRDSVERILSGLLLESHRQACGAVPINGMLLVARRHGLKPRLAWFCNSGDTAGDRQRVVGYAAFVFSPPSGADTVAACTSACTAEQGKAMLSIARASIEAGLGRQAGYDISAPWLQQPGAVFVTLTRGGQLRGCRGSVEPHRRLGSDIVENARASAFADPRFPPVTLPELPHLLVEVSLLGPTEPLQFSSEEDALRQLRPGVDGLVLACNRNRGTFLPQVWEKLRDPGQFLGHLKLKAGLPAGFWSDELRLYRYGVQKWSETPRKAAAANAGSLKITRPDAKFFYSFSMAGNRRNGRPG